MDQSKVIQVKNISKKFCKDLKNSMLYGVSDVLGFSHNQGELRKNEFWALRNVSFDLHKGEVLGIIGRNGAGKSTLLRMLSEVYPPTSGDIFVKGRLGALIAVGAGFHPHLTGAENIFLNGVLLGMSKGKVERCFERIVEFAEIDDFINSPVSTYSSGMKVRLGFAIAVFSDPEILLIDEVLAVGDLRFKKKCMRKIEEIKRDKSIIFISHNLKQVARLCTRVLWLEGGCVKALGNTEEVIQEYIEYYEESQYVDGFSLLEGDGTVLLEKLDINDGANSVVIYNSLNFKIVLASKKTVQDATIGFAIENSEGQQVAMFHNKMYGYDVNLEMGTNLLNISLKHVSLTPGRYSLSFKWRDSYGTVLLSGQGASFDIEGPRSVFSEGSVVLLESDWSHKVCHAD